MESTPVGRRLSALGDGGSLQWNEKWPAHFGGPFMSTVASLYRCRFSLGRGVTPWIAQPPGPVGAPTGPHVIILNGAAGSRFTRVRTFRLCALTSATFPDARRPTGSTLP